MNYTLPSEDKCSDMFIDSCYGSGGGALFIDCRCGIHHVAVDSDYMYDDADETCIIQPESDTVIYHRGVDGVSYIFMAGECFCTDCETCLHSLKRYEDWIWNNRNIIRSYLGIRIKQEKELADQEAVFNKLAGIE